MFHYHDDIVKYPCFIGLLIWYPEHCLIRTNSYNNFSLLFFLLFCFVGVWYFYQIVDFFDVMKQLCWFVYLSNVDVLYCCFLLFYICHMLFPIGFQVLCILMEFECYFGGKCGITWSAVVHLMFLIVSLAMFS
jgi:hypothetical protein